MTFTQASLELLKNADYKVTAPRRAVLSVLEKAETPLSAYDIEERIPKSISVNVVTVYRILDLFEKLGIVHRTHTKEGYVRCDFEGKQGCHYFAVCSRCGRTIEFLRRNKCLLKKIIPKDLPFRDLGHITEVSGICNRCASKMSA